MMTLRFCPTCATEVQDAGGFCMLGHWLGSDTSPLDGSPSDIDRAFGAFASQSVGTGARPSGPRTPPPPPPPPSKPAATVWDDLDDASLSPNDPITSFAPAPRMDWGPTRSLLSRVEALLNRSHRPSRASA
jgi:hypothetical protein